MRSCRLGSANAERDLLSSPSSRQMFPSGEPLDESSPLLWVRGNGDFVVDISSYSSNDRSAEDVEVGDKAGTARYPARRRGEAALGRGRGDGGSLAQLNTEGRVGGVQRFGR